MISSSCSQNRKIPVWIPKLLTEHEYLRHVPSRSVHLGDVRGLEGGWRGAIDGQGRVRRFDAG